jgi:sugar/nucleoside kinase (ribokinase family)
MATDGQKIYRCVSNSSATIVDTTGAGDAFGTGVTWARIQGMTLPEMLRAGTINATSVLGSFGAQKTLLTDTEMHIRIGQNPLPVEVHDFPSQL